MAGITTAVCSSAKSELFLGLHNFSASGGNAFKLALFKAGVAGTYGAGSINYSDMGGDETSGTGYTAGGIALTNVAPVLSGTTSYVSFSPNPSWTSATFSSDGGMIYNSTSSGRAFGVFSFGSTQTIAGGTFTLLMPPATASTAIFTLA